MVKAHYKMAAVVRLTGIPANTIRTWERRYNVVNPERSPGGARLYAESDISRLQLIGALLDFGEAISTLASLSTVELRERLDVHRRASALGTDERQSATLAVLGQGLASQLRAAPEHARIEVHVAFDGGGVEEFLDEPPQVDVLLVHLTALGSKPATLFQKLMVASSARLGVVVHDFARASTLWRLTDQGARLVQGPTRVSVLLQMIEDHLALKAVRKRAPIEPVVADDVRPERYFSRAQLGWLREANNGIDCECPNHLASLIEALNGFETYSDNCQNRNEDDAALHEALALGAAQARHGLEVLLQNIIEADGLHPPTR